MAIDEDMMGEKDDEAGGPMMRHKWREGFGTRAATRLY
jgi:hypothetical protein